VDSDAPYRCTTRGCAGKFGADACYCPVCGKAVRRVAFTPSTLEDGAPREGKADGDGLALLLALIGGLIAALLLGRLAAVV